MENDLKSTVLHEHKNKVHKVLLHSHSTFFFFFLIGILLDIIFPLKIFEKFTLAPIGIVLVLFATALIFWAQKSNRSLPVDKLGKHAFAQGPYKYMANPTHFGLILMLLGFGIAINALYLVIFTLVYHLIGHYVFHKKQDSLLEAKYGDHFKEYKKTVKF